MVTRIGCQLRALVGRLLALRDLHGIATHVGKMRNQPL
jgi:hypothetical protein